MANVGTGTAGKVLTATGVTSQASFSELGTNSGLTANGVVVANGNSPFTATAEGATGQVLTGVTGADPVWASPAASTITLTGTSGGALGPSNAFTLIGGTVAAGVVPVAVAGSGTTLTTNVQMSQAIAATDATKVGLASFDSASFGVDANGFVTFAGSTTDLHDSRFIVSAGGASDGANYTTIQSAITAATSGSTVFIQEGTYTENLTLKDGVNLASLANSFGVTPPVIILGKATLTSGTVAIDNICLKTNVDYICDVSGSANLNLYRCELFISSHAFLCDSGRINFFQCNLQDTGASSGAWFTCTNTSTILIQGCYFTGTTTTVSTFANSSDITIRNSLFQSFISTSETGRVLAYNSNLTAPSGKVFLTTSGTSLTNEIYNSYISSNATSSLSIGTGTKITISNVVIDSSNTTTISGAGTVVSSGISFINTGSGNTATTQKPTVSSNDAIKVVTPGAYPYTTVPQDAIILVDTSSARTITPLASPVTGQRHVIKDSVGSAATNNITVTPSGKNIDGSASYTMDVAYGSITIVYSGTQWLII